MPKLVCVDCEVELVIDKTGLPAVEMADFGPYILTEADRWRCPLCGWRVIAGFAEHGIEHWENGFNEAINMAKGRKGYIEFHQY